MSLKQRKSDIGDGADENVMNAIHLCPHFIESHVLFMKRSYT